MPVIGIAGIMIARYVPSQINNNRLLESADIACRLKAERKLTSTREILTSSFLLADVDIKGKIADSGNLMRKYEKKLNECGIYPK